ncbi:MAG TPA: glyoxylate/hydroxypyruvate reductase A [Casimicrobiaceae bacterium]|nr:glyoxylate/hydroxypyruvate reductase A [Casimicrobiaceae bacterium]
MKILLQSPRADEWQAPLASAMPEASVAVWPDAPANPDYALVWKPPAEVFVRARPRRAIFNLGAGVDGLMGVPTLPNDVPVIRLEDAGMAEQMADYVIVAVLRAYREMDVYAAQQREALWRTRPPPIAKSAFGVGFLGFGVLGNAVARALRPFGFPLYAWSRTRKVAPGVVSYAGFAELHEFLAKARVLVCLLPATADTASLLDRVALQTLPAGAHVVNVARGGIVVDEDLIALLDSGHLGGATLDVFREEPLPREHPFWHHSRIVLTPHISAITLVTDSIAQIAAKIRRLERGEPVTGVVDRVRGY